MLIPQTYLKYLDRRSDRINSCNHIFIHKLSLVILEGGTSKIRGKTCGIFCISHVRTIDDRGQRTQPQHIITIAATNIPCRPYELLMPILRAPHFSRHPIRRSAYCCRLMELFCCYGSRCIIPAAAEATNNSSQHCCCQRRGENQPVMAH